MKPAVYLSSSLLWDEPMVEVFRVAAELGYGGVEVWAEQWRQGDNDPAEVNRVRAELGLGCSVHASSWDLNLCALNSGIRAQSRAELAASIDLAATLGAPIVVVHPGRVSISSVDLPRHWAWLIEGIAELGAHAARAGITLGIESMERIRREFIVTPADLWRLHAGIAADNVGTTFDLAHVPPEFSVLDFWREMPKVVHVHLSDASGERLHLPLGSGDRGVRAALEVIWAEFEGAIAIEGYERHGRRGLATENKRVYDAWREAWRPTPARPAG